MSSDGRQQLFDTPPPRHRHRQQIAEIDLTSSGDQVVVEYPPPPTPPPPPHFSPSPFEMPGHHVRASPRNFNAAMRRVYTRRERLYDRDRPNVMREQVHMAEECPAPELHPARQSALVHLSRAYAVAGYAQAVLCVVVSAVLVAFIASFARGLLADVSRKTRLRADGAVRAASKCRMDYTENSCDMASESLTPALRAMCSEWRECIGREGNARRDAVSATVWAEAVAETFNAFAERISSTTVAIGLTCTVVMLFFMSSAAFGFMHRRLVDERLAAPPASPMPPSAAAVALSDKSHESVLMGSGLRPRAITFDPNESPSPMTQIAKRR